MYRGPSRLQQISRRVTGSSSAFSRGTLIVESEKRGGTAISAAMAIAQGRDVFAVPGSPYIRMSELSNALIKQGAVPVTSASDILSFYGFRSAIQRCAG